MKYTIEFTADKEWELFEAIDALMAYDLGATDSGVKDDNLKKKVQEFLRKLDNNDFRIATSMYAQKYLTDEKIAAGYGLEDVLCFVRWMRDHLNIDI